MFVLGTAGHIDHGKSVLVNALTGIDPDRLSEEKERGMTIDLGFAWLTLPSGRQVGIVDVPGHERFIKNMLAGVGGIDMALLIIAANEGVMPQTREHLAILDLLGISRGIVVITKKDLVDDEWLDLVKMEVEELIEPTVLSKAQVIAVSALKNEGLNELILSIDELLGSAIQRKDTGRARLPIDRIFTMAGSGTVVTGTLIDGSLSVGDEVEIVPGGLKSRIRGLQMHKTRVDTIEPGSRVAANLVGVTTSQLLRGNVVAKPGWLVPTRMLNARLKLLDYVHRPLKHNSEMSFFTGAAEATVKIRLLDTAEIKPGENAWVQLLLDRPVAVVNGDHFVIRTTSDTIGGGTITEVHTKRLRRFRPSVIEGLQVKEKGSAEEIVLALLEDKQPVETARLLNSSDMPQEQVKTVIDTEIEKGTVVKAGTEENALLFTSTGWQRLTRKLLDIIKEYHEKFPTRAGIPKSELGNKLRIKNISALISKLVSDGIALEQGNLICLPGRSITLSPGQQIKVDEFLNNLGQNPYSPTSNYIPEPDLLKLLVDQNKIVKMGQNVIFLASVYQEMVEKVTEYIKTNDKITLAEVRDIFKTSRKYAQAFIEYMDSQKITRRIGDERVLY